jgi:hypothetical protein
MGYGLLLLCVGTASGSSIFSDISEGIGKVAEIGKGIGNGVGGGIAKELRDKTNYVTQLSHVGIDKELRDAVSAGDLSLVDSMLHYRYPDEPKPSEYWTKETHKLCLSCRAMSGQSVAHLALAGGHIEIFEKLLQAYSHPEQYQHQDCFGIDQDDDYGITLLMLAAKKGQQAALAIPLLLKHGADPNRKAGKPKRNGHTAEEMAKSHGRAGSVYQFCMYANDATDKDTTCTEEANKFDSSWSVNKMFQMPDWVDGLSKQVSHTIHVTFKAVRESLEKIAEKTYKAITDLLKLVNFFFEGLKNELELVLNSPLGWWEKRKIFLLLAPAPIVWTAVTVFLMSPGLANSAAKATVAATFFLSLCMEQATAVSFAGKLITSVIGPYLPFVVGIVSEYCQIIFGGLTLIFFFSGSVGGRKDATDPNLLKVMEQMKRMEDKLDRIEKKLVSIQKRE